MGTLHTRHIDIEALMHYYLLNATSNQQPDEPTRHDV